MGENNNFFDLNDLSDLPGDVKKEIFLVGFQKNTVMLLSLFNIKNPLSIDEMIVGMMRKYNIKKKRNWFAATIYNLKKRKVIRKIEGKELYEKIGG